MPEPERPIAVTEEVLRVEKRDVTTGRVRVETRTETREEMAEAELVGSDVDVVRVPVGRDIDAMPVVRTEGAVTIIPVVEERLVVERRLVLREEIHITRRRVVETVQVPVELRKQQVEIMREGRTMSEGQTTMTDATTNIGTNADRTLTAFYDDRASAEAAEQRLRDLGLVEASIRLTGGEDYAGRAEYREDRGFWDGMLDFFFPGDEAPTYAEGIRRGGYLLSVSAVPPERYDLVLDILDDEGSVDLDERAAAWEAEGWSGAGAAGIGAGASVGAASSSFGSDTVAATGFDPKAEPTGGAVAGSGAMAGGAATEPRIAGDDETIQVVEERLRVGKRDRNLGRVKVRSYVVEEPASADVTLREQRVEIDRRPVDRSLGAGEAAFVDRTLEAEEHAEEAVVSKEARVTEEIGLRRQADERTETVSDTVRRTEVEIEDERDGAADTRPGERRGS